MARRVEHVGNSREQRAALSREQGREARAGLKQVKPEKLPDRVANQVSTVRRTCWDN